MKKLLGIMLCVGTLTLGGCAANDVVNDDDIISRLEDVESNDMSPTGRVIKIKFEKALFSLSTLSELDENDYGDYTDSDLVVVVNVLTHLFDARNDLQNSYSTLNKTDIKVLSEMDKKADDMLDEIDKKNHKLLQASLDVVSNDYRLPDGTSVDDYFNNLYEEDDYSYSEPADDYSDNYSYSEDYSEEYIGGDYFYNEYYSGGYIGGDYSNEDDYYVEDDTETDVCIKTRKYNTLLSCIVEDIEEYSDIIDRYGIYETYLDIYTDRVEGGLITVIIVGDSQPTDIAPENLLSFVDYLPEAITTVIIEFDGGYVNNNVVYDKLTGNYYFNEESSLYY